MKFGIILTPDNRSKAYLQKIVSQKISLDLIIFLNDNRQEIKNLPESIIQSKKHGFDISEAVSETLKKNSLKFKEFPFVDINNKELIRFIKNNKVDYLIFSGGGILKEEILSSKTKFIHFHPGIVPDYKGSTCFYYSILDKDQCGVSAIIMDIGLDTGNIIYQRIFKKPSHEFIDDVFDPHIRSETLMDVLKKINFEKLERKNQNSNDGDTYFIIHPVLKHIAILSCN